jgi:hypothetical protein
MKRDYSEEVKNFIKNYKKEDIVFGKNIDFLLRRVEISKEEMEEEVIRGENLSFVEKQI